MHMQWKLYADASLPGRIISRQPQPGAYAYIFKSDNGDEREGVEGLFASDITRLELMGVVRGLQDIQDCSPDGNHQVNVFSDSQYVHDVIARLLSPEDQARYLEHSRVPKRWRTRTLARLRKQNTDLYDELRAMLPIMRLTFEKVSKTLVAFEHHACHCLAGQTRLQFAKDVFGKPPTDPAGMAADSA